MTEFAQRQDKFVELDHPPTLITRALQSAEVTATRVRWDDFASGYPTRLERNDGYLVCLQRLSLPACPYWVDGQPMPRMPLDSGQFLLLNLNEEHSAGNRKPRYGLDGVLMSKAVPRDSSPANLIVLVTEIPGLSGQVFDEPLAK